MSDRDTLRAELARELADFASEILGYASRVAGRSASLGVETETRLVLGRVDSMAQNIRDFANRNDLNIGE